MNGTFWEPIHPAPRNPNPNPNLYLAGVCIPLPIWLLTAFILVFLVPGTVNEYRLTHDQGGVAGTVTLTWYTPPNLDMGTAAVCKGSFQPAKDVPAHRRETVEVFLKGECRLGTKLPARVCPEDRFPYRDDCERYAWTEGSGIWKSPLVPIFVAGPVWLLCTAVMLASFFRWRRAVREAPNDLAQRPGTDGLGHPQGMDDLVQRPGKS